MRGRHWSETLVCSCGASFRTVTTEAKHRHNFPALCRPKRGRAVKDIATNRALLQVVKSVVASLRAEDVNTARERVYDKAVKMGIVDTKGAR